MKKILSFILACVLCVALIPSSAFADTVSADDMFGVILDAEGNVVEYLQMPRGDVYVNKVYVIPGGGKLITLQYSLTQSFLFGYSTRDVDQQTYITEPNRTFEISIELSNTIGGGNRVTMADYIKKCFTKASGYTHQGSSILCRPDDTYYEYCNGKLVNTSSSSLTVRIIIIRNPDANYDDWRNLV